MGVYPGGAKVARFSDAHISEDGRYRYSLMRTWASGRVLPFIMLNPSTADALVDDPTIRRCVAFAVDLGYSGIKVRNLFAYRTRSPQELLAAHTDGVDVVGPLNDSLLKEMLAHAQRNAIPVIAGWGNALPPKVMKPRVDWLKGCYGSWALHSLGVTKAGHPRHPLYLPATARLHYWPPKEERADG